MKHRLSQLPVYIYSRKEVPGSRRRENADGFFYGPF